MGNHGVGHQCLRVDNAARHIDLDRRCALLQTTSLQDEVLECLVVGILVDARIHHLTVNGDGAFYLCLLLRGHEEHVVLAQRDIGHSAVEHALQVDAQHFQRAVGLHAVHHGAVQEGLFGHTLSSLDERAHGGDVAAQLVHTLTEHGTLQLDGVLIAVEDAVDAHRVAVGHVEGSHIELTHVEHRELAARLAEHAHRLLVGIAREAAGVFQQRAHALVLSHLVEHRALHLTREVHQAVVGLHHDEVVVGQSDVACLLAVEDIVVDVDGRNQLVAAIHLDVTQRTDVADTLRHIEGVEHGREGRQRIGAGSLHLAHHVHRDRACLAQRELDLAALVAGTERRPHAGIGLRHRESAHLHRTEALDVDITVGAHRAFNLAGGSTVDVDVDGIARPEHVVLRGGDVDAGLERQVLVVEDVAAEHLLLLLLALSQNLLQQRDRVHRHQAAQLQLHLQEVVVLLIVGVLLVALALHAHVCHLRSLLLGLRLARTVVGLAHGLVLHHAQTRLVLLAFGNLLHTANLLNVNTTLHQLRHNLLLSRTCLVLLQHEAHHLVVGHRRLGRSRQRQQQPNQDV